MSDKVAVVVDTNFIIQNQKLDKKIAELQDMYLPYVTEVSVEERIAQQCKEAKVKIESIQKVQDDYRGIATVKLITSYDRRTKEIRTEVQAAYKKTFGACIIPLLRDSDTYAEVLERAFVKTPPFISDEAAGVKPGGKSTSDKGFKDSLIWLSMLHYFKDSGEKRVIFISDDNGFRNQSTILCAEFKKITGKEIEIRENSYFRELCQKSTTDSEEKKNTSIKEPLPDVRSIRERINAVVNAICGFEDEDSWGEYQWVRYFSINKTVDSKYMEVVMSGLDDEIAEHLFSQTIPAVKVLGLDDRVTDGDYGIPIEALEDFSRLYHDVRKKHPEFIQQFYTTVSSIINGNYVAPPIKYNIFDGELPF